MSKILSKKEESIILDKLIGALLHEYCNFT